MWDQVTGGLGVAAVFYAAAKAEDEVFTKRDQDSLGS